MLWIVRVLLYFPLNKSDDTISTLLLIFENKLLLCIWEHTCIHRHKENFGSQRTLYSYFFHFPHNKDTDISTFSGRMYAKQGMSCQVFRNPSLLCMCDKGILMNLKRKCIATKKNIDFIIWMEVSYWE